MGCLLAIASASAGLRPPIARLPTARLAGEARGGDGSSINEKFLIVNINLRYFLIQSHITKIERFYKT